MDMSSDTNRHNNDPRQEDVAVDNIISQELHKLDFNDDNADIGATHHENEHRDDDENDDFTFVFIGDDENNSSPAGAINAFEDGQNFPLFDQKLLLDGTEYELEQVHDHQKYLPFQPPVNRVFTELPSRGGSESSSSKKMQNDRYSEEAVAGSYCEWSSTSNNSPSSHHDHNDGLISKKSNSTGFSKLWRLREKVHRSNSDGRDAFVFLKHSSNDHKTTSSSSSSSTNKGVVSHGDDHRSHGTFVKVNNNGNGSTRKGPKVVKKTTISPHEAYMRSRGGHTEEERRKSYLPYRPELMGFFTNVHGGLSKNVHPY